VQRLRPSACAKVRLLQRTILVAGASCPLPHLKRVLPCLQQRRSLPVAHRPVMQRTLPQLRARCAAACAKKFGGWRTAHITAPPTRAFRRAFPLARMTSSGGRENLRYDCVPVSACGAGVVINLESRRGLLDLADTTVCHQVRASHVRTLV
jgi:hypothetical protein